MLLQYKSLLGLSSRMLLLPLVLMLTVSCSNPALSLLTGGGPNVAANTQVGKENTQTIGINNSIRPVLRPEGDVETVVQDSSTTKNTEIDPLLLLLLILGWLAPSPNEIARGFMKLFRRKQ